jgi:hypothetical protein
MARHGAFAMLAGESTRTVPAQHLTTAQLPHNRTVPHKFSCRLLHKDAK